MLCLPGEEHPNCLLHFNARPLAQGHWQTYCLQGNAAKTGRPWNRIGAAPIETQRKLNRANCEATSRPTVGMHTAAKSMNHSSSVCSGLGMRQSYSCSGHHQRELILGVMRGHEVAKRRAPSLHPLSDMPKSWSSHVEPLPPIAPAY